MKQWRDFFIPDNSKCQKPSYPTSFTNIWPSDSSISDKKSVVTSRDVNTRSSRLECGGEYKVTHPVYL